MRSSTRRTFLRPCDLCHDGSVLAGHISRPFKKLDHGDADSTGAFAPLPGSPRTCAVGIDVLEQPQYLEQC